MPDEVPTIPVYRVLNDQGQQVLFYYYSYFGPALIIIFSTKMLCLSKDLE